MDDEDSLRKSVRDAKEIGFDGKGCIHPKQIKPIHEEFAPTKSEIDKAINDKPNLILMDLSLPIINGWDATKKIMKGRRGSTVSGFRTDFQSSFACLEFFLKNLRFFWKS